MAQLVHSQPQMVIVPAGATPGMKDSRWLTLEVCREFQRSKCSRTDLECKFAHPPPHVEVQNGRVVACFDSIKGKCQRKEPLCKYLHPPQHLREQLLQNGRNNLILKNLQLQAYQQTHYTSVMPVAYETGAKTVAVPAAMPGQYSYLTHYPGLQTLSAVQTASPAATYSPYLTSFAMPTAADSMSMMSQQLPPNMISAKALRADKYETSVDNCDAVTTHASLMESFSYPTYISQATSSAPMQHTMVYAKKRPRDPVDEYLLQSTVPGLVPAYKRIAMSDISKGGFPMYQTNPLMSQLQPASLMQLQQHPSYFPVTYTYVYPSDATLVAPEISSPFARSSLSAAAAPTLVPPRPSTSTTTAVSSVISDVTTDGNIDDSAMTSPSGLSLYMFSKSNTSASTQSVTSTPNIPNNAYYVEYFGNNKQLRDTLQVCQEFSSGLCSNSYCKLVHLSEDYVEVNNNQVTVCRDFATRKSCRRSRCKYYHIPVELPPS